MTVTDRFGEIAGLPPARQVLGWLGRRTWGRRLLNVAAQGSGVYRDFAEALAESRQAARAGHEHPEAIRRNRQASGRIRPSDYPALFWLQSALKPGQRVLDYGGNDGTLFHNYRRLLPSLDEVDWCVVDLSAVVAEGRRLAEAQGVARLRFADNLREAVPCDVLLASGSLHYWEHSVGEFLSSVGMLPEWIILNRTPIHPDGPEFHVVQRTHEYAIPAVVRNREEMVQAFAAQGYRLLDTWQAPEKTARKLLFPEYRLSFEGFVFHQPPGG